MAKMTTNSPITKNKAKFLLSGVNYPYMDYMFDKIYQFWNFQL